DGAARHQARQHEAPSAIHNHLVEYFTQTADCRLPTADWPLPTGYCRLATADWLLPTGYCLLATAYWLLVQTRVSTVTVPACSHWSIEPEGCARSCDSVAVSDAETPIHVLGPSDRARRSA